MSTNFCVESILQSINSNSLEEEDSNKNSPQLTTSNKSPSSSSSNFESSQKAFSPKKHDSPVQKKRKADKENKKPAKRTRTCFERTQLIYLEKIFAETPYPDKLLKDEIAEKQSLAPQRIHVWFQNRRSKQRKLTGNPDPRAAPPTQTPTTLTGSFLQPLPQPPATPAPLMYPPQLPPYPVHPMGVYNNRPSTSAQMQQVSPQACYSLPKSGQSFGCQFPLQHTSPTLITPPPTPPLYLPPYTTTLVPGYQPLPATNMGTIMYTQAHLPYAFNNSATS